jgi:hypothetical protein
MNRCIIYLWFSSCFGILQIMKLQLALFYYESGASFVGALLLGLDVPHSPSTAPSEHDTWLKRSKDMNLESSQEYQCFPQLCFWL